MSPYEPDSPTEREGAGIRDVKDVLVKAHPRKGTRGVRAHLRKYSVVGSVTGREFASFQSRQEADDYVMANAGHTGAMHVKENYR